MLVFPWLQNRYLVSSLVTSSLDTDYFERNSIHLHVPEGATPARACQAWPLKVLCLTETEILNTGDQRAMEVWGPA